MNEKIPAQFPQDTNKTKQLDAVGLETLTAILAHKTKTQAAEALSIDRSTLYQRIEKYGLEDFIAGIPKRALQTLQINTERAAEVIVNKLDDHKRDFEAAKEILDRTGIRGRDSERPVQVNVYPILGGASVSSNHSYQKTIEVNEED